MEKLKLNIEAIRAQLCLSRKEFADSIGITIDRYNRLAVGETSMLAWELVKIHDISGIPYENINVAK